MIISSCRQMKATISFVRSFGSCNWSAVYLPRIRIAEILENIPEYSKGEDIKDVCRIRKRILILSRSSLVSGIFSRQEDALKDAA